MTDNEDNDLIKDMVCNTEIRGIQIIVQSMSNGFDMTSQIPGPVRLADQSAFHFIVHPTALV